MAWLERRGKLWYISSRNAAGKIKRLRGYTDKEATKQLAAKMERERARGEQGLLDPFKDHRRHPLTFGGGKMSRDSAAFVDAPTLKPGQRLGHFEDYAQHLRTLGRSASYIRNSYYRLKKLAKACKWDVLNDVSDETFCTWRSAIPLRSDGKPRIGPTTQNHYLDAVYSFCAWCVGKRMLLNPMEHVQKVDSTNDIRRERRALTLDELQALIDVVALEHIAVYRFMLGSGLRREEVDQLIWGDIRLNATKPFIQLRAKATKSKRADVLPLHSELATELRAARGDAVDGDRVFPMGVPTIEQHRAYLAIAGIEWEDSEGRRADIHAMRKCLGTMLTATGAMPYEAKEIMRHSDVRTTMKIYTDRGAFDLSDTIDRLTLPSPRADRESARATGTDGRTADEKVAPQVAGAHRNMPDSEGHLAKTRAQQAIATADDVTHLQPSSTSVRYDAELERVVSIPTWGSDQNRVLGNSNAGNPPTSLRGGSATGSNNLPTDLLAVISAWPSLSDSQRKSIVSIAKEGK